MKTIIHYDERDLNSLLDIINRRSCEGGIPIESYNEYKKNIIGMLEVFQDYPTPKILVYGAAILIADVYVGPTKSDRTEMAITFAYNARNWSNVWNNKKQKTIIFDDEPVDDQLITGMIADEI